MKSMAEESKAKVTKEKKKCSYLTYNKLVGEADGGKELSPEQFQNLLKLYKESWKNRLYVHFSCMKTGKDCVRVKPPCLCFCGHTFKSHEWWDVDSKMVKCRCPGCKCPQFRYLHHQGSWYLQCRCKHSAIEHQKTGKPSECQHKGCNCPGFQTSFACQCGYTWNDHQTLAETEEERKKSGKPIDPDVVKKRIRNKKVEGCGKCVGCKCRMGCSLKK